jgi:hypothetical protein
MAKRQRFLFCEIAGAGIIAAPAPAVTATALERRKKSLRFIYSPPCFSGPHR